MLAPGSECFQMVIWKHSVSTDWDWLCWAWTEDLQRLSEHAKQPGLVCILALSMSQPSLQVNLCRFSLRSRLQDTHMHCRHTHSHLDRCLFKTRRSSGFPSQIRLIRRGGGFSITEQKREYSSNAPWKTSNITFQGFVKHESILLFVVCFYSIHPLIGFPKKALLVSSSSSSNCIVFPLWVNPFFIAAPLWSWSAKTYENYYADISLSPKTRMIYLYLTFAEDKCWDTGLHTAVLHSNDEFCSCCYVFKIKML